MRVTFGRHRYATYPLSGGERCRVNGLTERSKLDDYDRVKSHGKDHGDVLCFNLCLILSFVTRCDPPSRRSFETCEFELTEH